MKEFERLKEFEGSYEGWFGVRKTGLGAEDDRKVAY